MSAQETVASHPLLRHQRVRFRCAPCEVAWTSDEDDTCWNCGERGVSLRTAFSLREDDYLHLDFE